MAWKFVGTCSCDSFIIDGIDIFKEDWKSTGECVQVVDPLYGQNFTFNVWEIKKSDQTINFVAGEFSNNIFGIYLYKQ